MYKGFFGLVVLTLLIGAHCVYLWHGRREKKPAWSTGRKVWLLLAAALYVCALAAGLVVVLTGQDAVISHAMGVLALVLALWFDSMLSRACGEKNDLEA